MFALIESTRNFVPSKSSVKARNSFFILHEKNPEIAISMIIAERVTMRNNMSICVVIAEIEVLRRIIIIKPL